MKPPFLKGYRRDRFEALQAALVPLFKSFNEEQRQKSRELVNLVLADKSRIIHFKIALFLWVIDMFSILRGGHSFKNLAEDKKYQALDFFFASPVALLRKGFWGLNTLAKIGVYGQHSVYPRLNYQLKETPRG